MPFNGNAVKELRRRENWNQSELGKLLGLTLQQVSQSEQRNSNPKVQILDRMYQIAVSHGHPDLEFYHYPSKDRSE